MDFKGNSLQLGAMAKTALSPTPMRDEKNAKKGRKSKEGVVVRHDNDKGYYIALFGA